MHKTSRCINDNDEGFRYLELNSPESKSFASDDASQVSSSPPLSDDSVSSEVDRQSPRLRSKGNIARFFVLRVKQYRKCQKAS
jgi:hypothetical protein